MIKKIVFAALLLATPVSAIAQNRAPAVNRAPVVDTFHPDTLVHLGTALTATNDTISPRFAAPTPQVVATHSPTRVTASGPLLTLPTPTPTPVEPKDWDQALKLAALFAQLAVAAYNTGSLVAYALAALALAYLLMFLIKTAIKDSVAPEKYLGAMKKALAFLTVAAMVAGYFAGGGGLMGVVTGGAAGLGTAASSLVHDLIDGFASHRKSGSKPTDLLK